MKSVEDRLSLYERVRALYQKSCDDAKLLSALSTHLLTNSFAGLRLDRMSEFDDHVSDPDLRRL